MQKIPDNFLNTKKPQHRSPKTRVTLSPLQTQKVSEPSNRRLFTLHYIPANVHVGSNIERIPQDKHTRQKNWGLRKIPSGLVRAGADADDVALWNTWATVSRAHINKATLARLGSRSSCRCQCAGGVTRFVLPALPRRPACLPLWHRWGATLMIWSFYSNWWIPPACLSHGLKATILMWKR